MILECHHIPNLTHLKLTGFTFQSDKTKFQCLIDSIWSLPKLVYCNLDIYLFPANFFCAENTLQRFDREVEWVLGNEKFNQKISSRFLGNDR